LNADDSGYYVCLASNKLGENVRVYTYVSIKNDSLESNLVDFIKSEDNQTNYTDILNEQQQSVYSNEITNEFLIPYERIDSNILINDILLFDLIALLEMPKNTEWNLLYRASRDGFSAANFHSKCDFRGKFLVLIKTNLSFIFGAYTESDWSRNGFQNDQNAFIFSLSNKENTPIKFKCVDPKYAVYSNPNHFYGPTFGKGHDLFISDNSNSSSNSFSNLGISYQNPSYTNNNDSRQAQMLLAGSFNFKTDEIEVFYKNCY